LAIFLLGKFVAFGIIQSSLDLQLALHYEISLGQAISDHSKRMITLTKLPFPLHKPAALSCISGHGKTP
jgi:hypothetical protein